MPELPEVETIRRTLQGPIEGKKITDLIIYYTGSIHRVTPVQLRDHLINRKIVTLDRRGKYLIILLEGNGRLVIDLRMTGRLIVRPQDQSELNRHTRVIFQFNDGTMLRFDDQRKFGRLIWFPDETSMETQLKLGPEPIDDQFGPDIFASIIKGRKRPIKSLLLDQRLISGLGNIYADEALFKAGIAPERPAGELNRDEIVALVQACRYVLHQGIQHRGTTLRDYVDGDGRQGEFGEYLQVYGREGKPCYTCNEQIIRIKLAGRSSHYCPGCQR